MTTVVTRGAASAQALGYAARSSAINYIEDVFSTYLYTGTGSGQTITNGIDLSGKGGMVWAKNRSTSDNHYLADTARGATKYICSDLTQAEITSSAYFSSLNSNGFTVGTNLSALSTWNYASWTFRKQAKFFDVVTYTGNDTDGRTVAHNLGSVPGCIMIKRTDTAADWQVYHRGIGNTRYLVLNSTAAQATATNRWFNTTPTDTVFTLGKATAVNANGGTYVAYLFAHDAGGFGQSGTDNVITCGSYTGTGTPAFINLGYEPQWILIKPSSAASDWRIHDSMRGMPVGSTSQVLFPNLSSAETAPTQIDVSANGFTPSSYASNGATYIYIAIRRGPMKTPTPLNWVEQAGSLMRKTYSNSFGLLETQIRFGPSAAPPASLTLCAIRGRGQLRP